MIVIHSCKDKLEGKPELTMTDLLPLPFDIHVVIARKLTLKDSLSYAQVSTVCHDAVYVFAHRTELDFSSVLVDNNHVSLPDTLFLTVLHAHTKATSIRYFCIPGSFSSFNDFSNYLNLYWKLTFIPSYDESTPDSDTICGRYVGHQQGHLQSIYYTGYFGTETVQQGLRLRQILMYFDNEYCSFQITSEGDLSLPLLPESLNWGTVDIDAPYSRFTICDIQINHPLTLCPQCTQIQEILGSIN